MKFRSFFYFLTTIQILFSTFFSIFITFPDFKFQICKVQLFSDWYPVFFYSSMKCTNEVGKKKRKCLIQFPIY